MPNNNITQQVQAIHNSAAKHRGESALIFHLATWITELQQPESNDFLAADLSHSLAVAAVLVAEELQQ